MQVISLLRQLSETDGISGFERPARELVRQTWQPFVDEMREDKLGSLIALKRGSGNKPRPKLMLAAHLDENGLMVTGIEKGFLRITRVGGTDSRVLLGLEVIVHGQRELPGIVATRPPHVLPAEERKKPVPWDKLFVDVGLPAKEVEQLVSVGDLISIRREMVELENRRVAGKAMDNRACVAIVTLALEQLAGMRHAWDIFAVATAQEETGLKGAITAAYNVAPDLAVALDVGFAKQPGVSEMNTFPLGEGPFHRGRAKLPPGPRGAAEGNRRGARDSVSHRTHPGPQRHRRLGYPGHPRRNPHGPHWHPDPLHAPAGGDAGRTGY